MNKSDCIEQIKSWLSTHRSTTLPAWLNRNSEILTWVNDNTAQYPAKNVMERVYIVMHGVPNPCEYGNHRKFNTFELGYRKGCILGNQCKCIGKTRMAVQKATLKTKYGVDSVNQIPGVLDKRRQTNLEKYGVEYPAQSKIVQQTRQTNWDNQSQEYKDQLVKKRKTTFIEKYGVDHHMKLVEQQNKVKATNIARYGVEFPLQNATINKKFKNSIKMTDYSLILEKAKSTNLKKYGVEYVSQRNLPPETVGILSNGDLFREFVTGKTRVDAADALGIHLHCLYLRAKQYDAQPLFATPLKSQFEKEVEDFLNQLGVGFESNTRNVICPKELDFYIPSRKLAIECNGLYWHCELSSGRTPEYHYEKYESCKHRGIKLISLCDSEWRTRRPQLENRIRHALNLSKNRFYARQCTINHIGVDAARTFMDLHHTLGPRAEIGDICVGLFNNDQIVSVMSISTMCALTENTHQLMSFCSIGTVVGSASKLFTYLLRNYNIKSMISYSDNQWGYCSLYDQLGFKFVSNNIGYSYTYDYKEKIDNHTINKSNLVAQGFPKELSTWQILQNLGYDRIWNCGQSLWVFNSNK